MKGTMDFFRLGRGRGEGLTLVLSVMLALTLAGCATTDDESIEISLKELSSCEQDLVDIRKALCERTFDGKPKTDPHDVIGLAKPKTDPHKACFSTWGRLSAFDGQVCDCEARRASLMYLISSCYESAKGNEGAYSACLDKLRNYFGTGCPVSSGIE